MPYSWSDPHGFTPGESVGLATWLGQLGGDLWYLRDRVDWPYQNTSGRDLATGLLLIQDTGDEAALTLPAPLVGERGPFWVTLAPILDGASGYAARTGVVVLNYQGPDPVPGDRLQTSTLAGYCQAGTLNAFATALTTGHSGLLYALLDGPGGSGGGGGGSGDATSIQGEDVDPATPAEGDVLTYTGGLWVPTAPSGGGGGGGGGSVLWDPYVLAVPPVATSLSVHDNWASAGILTDLTQEGDAVLFKNPGAPAPVERGAFGTTSGPYAVPTTGPFTATVCFIPNLYSANYWSAQLSLRQSGNDKRITARLAYNGGVLNIDGVNWTDYQNVSGTFGTLPWPWGFPIWLRIRDDNATCYWEVSKDGKWWTTYTSGGTRSFCTPDQAGVTMDTVGGAPGSTCSMTVLSLSVVNTA